MRLRASVAPFVLGAALVSVPAFAQDAAPEAASEEVEAIVVTGSRIARPDLENASPVAIVSGEEFKLQATTNVENILNDLPQVVGSASGSSNNPGGGVATVDLRGLGTQRTLVLVDGRRYVAYDVNQVVDLNTIPQALIERVDVVTGGRSAVYGSDAIAGVVNFVTKRDFQGFELGSTYEVSSRGDGGRFNVNGTIGGNFDDGRGNVTLSVDYYKRKSIFAGQRSWSRNSFNDLRNGTFTPGGSSSVPQGRVNIKGLGALLGFVGTDGKSIDNLDFSPDGNLTPYVSATDAYNTNPVNYLQVPQERFLAAAQAQYEVSSAFTPYFEAQFINNRVDNELAATPISNSTPRGAGLNAGPLGPLQLHAASPFFAPQVQNALAQLDADGDGYVSAPGYGFRTLGLGARRNEDDRNAYRFVVGAKGDLGSGWSYDGYYMYARTKNSQRQSGNVALSSLTAATQTAFQNPTTGAISATPFAGVPGGGNLVCSSADARAQGCVPANLFGLNNLSPEAAAYLGVDSTNLEEYTTQVASASITNSNLFDLGAGGAGIALGAEWRSERGSVTPDTFLSSGNVAGFNPGAPTAGGYSVTEFFAEVNVPLLADTFIDKLEVNGAARYSDYSNAPGNVFTWSAGSLLQIVKDIGFRGQYQRAIRGPSVYELFLGQTVSFEGQSDPCGNTGLSQAVRDRCIATGVPANLVGDSSVNGPSINPPSYQSGNPDLREEKSDTWTIGGVITPSFLPGFTATVDYYNIKIDGYIGTIGEANIFDACYNQGIDEFCQLFTRNSLGQIDKIIDARQNSGGLKTDGIDVAAGYRFTLPSFLGAEEPKLSFNFSGSRVLNYEFTPVTGLDIVNECAGKFGNSCKNSVGQPLPKWRHSLRTTLATGPVTTSVQWRYFGKVRDDNPDVIFATETIKAQNYFDLSMSADVGEHLNLTAAVNNVFDKNPPFVISSQNLGNGEQSNTFPSVYDVLGRYFSVGARMRF